MIPFQFSLADRSFIIGPGTSYVVNPSFKGFGSSVTSFDGDRGSEPGEYGGPDTAGARVGTIPVTIKQPRNPNAAGALFAALKAGWRRSRTEMALDACLPIFPTTDHVLRFYGRPRGVDEKLDNLIVGHIEALCSFKLLDPFGYGSAETTTGASGSFTITNSGSEATDRVTLTIHGSGGTPQLVNSDDTTGNILWDGVLAGGATRTLDFRAKTIVDGSAIDRYGEMATGRRWFKLQPGANHLTLTGATSVDITFRPAWE